MRAATLRDVAAAAGVGVSTVSYVLNGTGLHKVGPETRERILRAAERLDYRPNNTARGLKSGKSLLIGVLVSGVNYSFMPEILQGIEEVLAEHKYNMLLCTFKDETELAERCGILLQKQVDGVICHPGGMPGCNALVNDFFSRLPGIWVASEAYGHFPTVQVPATEVGRIGMRYLLGLGHRRIAFFRHPSRSRYEGALTAVAEAGLDPEPVLYCIAAHHTDAPAVLAELRRLKEWPSAIFYFGDEEAIQFMLTARSMGIRVPDHISVLGVNGQEIGALVTPRLTSVWQSRGEQGSEAARRLLAWIGTGRKPESLLLPPKIVERESVRRMD